MIEVQPELDGGRLSPRDIVQRRQKNEWDLALVQRDEVWKEDRIRLLLDSLIMDYPIGSLLFCQIERPGSAVIGMGAGPSGVRPMRSGVPQLVDGQQRIFAIFSIFTGQGYGRFYLNPFREPSRDAGYIVWRRFDPILDISTEGFDERLAEPVADRERYIDLSNWMSIDERLKSEIDAARVGEIVRMLDGQFRLPHSEEWRSQIASRLEQVRAAWLHASIPMILAKVREPEDVLEVFTRVNRGGAPVSGNDLYFAAVKTFWHDPQLSKPGEQSAHTALKEIADATGGLLDIYGALSLVSRLALAGLGLSDMVPVSVDRLSRANKGPILRSMKAIAPTVARSSRWFTDALRRHTRLGFALTMTRQQIWEEVFAFVVASSAEREWTASDVADVEEYALGTTLFGYQQVLGDAFRRDAFSVALAAGGRDSRMPVHEVIGVAHGRRPKLERGRQRVRGITALDERLALARSNPGLLVALAQRLPLDWTHLDLDHVLAAANQSRFRLPRGFGRRYAEEHTYLNWPGNFWFLDSSANRSVQELPPREKFAQLRKWAVSDPDGKGRIGPGSHSAMTDGDLEKFEDLGDALAPLSGIPLEDRPPQIREVGSQVSDAIRRRTEQLLNAALQTFPGVAHFAADADVQVAEVPDHPAILASRLGINHLLGAFGLDPESLSTARQRATERIYARRDALRVALSERVLELAEVEESWIWPRTRKPNPGSWIAFRLRGGHTIELGLHWSPEFGERLLVKAYPKTVDKLFSDFDQIPLGESIEATDAEIVEAFARHIIELQRSHPQ